MRAVIVVSQHEACWNFEVIQKMLKEQIGLDIATICEISRDDAIICISMSLVDRLNNLFETLSGIHAYYDLPLRDEVDVGNMNNLAQVKAPIVTGVYWLMIMSVKIV